MWQINFWSLMTICWKWQSWLLIDIWLQSAISRKYSYEGYQLQVVEFYFILYFILPFFFSLSVAVAIAGSRVKIIGRIKLLGVSADRVCMHASLLLQSLKRPCWAIFFSHIIRFSGMVLWVCCVQCLSPLSILLLLFHSILEECVEFDRRLEMLADGAAVLFNIHWNHFSSYHPSKYNQVGIPGMPKKSLGFQGKALSSLVESIPPAPAPKWPDYFHAQSFNI